MQTNRWKLITGTYNLQYIGSECTKWRWHAEEEVERKYNIKKRKWKGKKKQNEINSVFLGFCSWLVVSLLVAGWLGLQETWEMGYISNI